MTLAGQVRRIAFSTFTKVAGDAVALFVRIVTAPRAIWAGSVPVAGPRVYFANHTSNADFVLIWALLPPVLRRRTRPVAALDYWLASPKRAFFGRDVFRAVLIDRRPEARTEDPVAQMIAALDAGSALIMFPEGRRNTTDDALLPFKSGLYHLARQRPEIDLIPVWISNLNRVLPRGEIVPVPLICTVSYGAPLRIAPDEPREAFLGRASEALAALKEPRP